MFQLHPQLQNDTFLISDLPLCRALLMNDSQFPWVILVPRRENCRELYDLSESDYVQYQQESLLVSKALMQEFRGDKLNIAALGNIVPQLHIHHIVRFKNDIAWPNPIWGKQATKPYSQTSQQEAINKIRTLLQPLAIC